MAKQDFRNAYKTDFLGSIDLEGLMEDGSDLIFTVNKVVHGQQNVAGKKAVFNVAYFEEDIKPLVLNSTNAKILRRLSGSKSVDPNDWPAVRIQLYVDDNVKFAGDVVSGVRIKDKAIEVKTIDVSAEIKQLRSCTTLEDLQKTYISFSTEVKNMVVPVKDEMKDKLTPKQ